MILNQDLKYLVKFLLAINKIIQVNDGKYKHKQQKQKKDAIHF
jgi:hypothetical protein